MERIYITPRSITQDGHPALKRLEQAGYKLIFAPPGKQPTEKEQLRILPDCIAYLAGIETISAKVLQVAKNLKVISRNGVGIENIDLEAAKSFGIEIKIASGTNSQAVAELTVALMLSLVRSIPNSNKCLKNGKWKRFMGIQISGKILGIIGVGNIGKKVVNMALGLEMKVLGYDVYPDQDFQLSKNFKYTSLNELLRNSDIISLHCPPSDQPIISRDTLKMMKDGIFIINTARAGLIDKDDLIKALDNGKVGGYATDVYDVEPPELDSLICHGKTICTPHIGGYTRESIDKAVETAVDNILGVL
ncbi:MAG: phosphoglycerate dehydrogenase [Promethearchaeota archaeon]